MTYRADHSGGNRGAVLTGVGVLHLVAAYALVTGLAGVIVGPLIPPPNPRASDIPVDVPLTPLPPTSHQPDKPQPSIQPSMDTGPMPMPSASPVLEFPLNPPQQPTGTDQGSIRPQTFPSPSLTPQAASPIGDPGTWAGPDDYPSRDLIEGHSGITRFRLSVGSDGRVNACEVTLSSGWPGLDQATCRLVSRRAHFRPATDSGGTRVAGEFANAIRWTIPR